MPAGEAVPTNETLAGELAKARDPGPTTQGIAGGQVAIADRVAVADRMAVAGRMVTRRAMRARRVQQARDVDTRALVETA